MVKILPKFSEINPLLNYRLVSVVVEGIQEMKIMVLLLVLLVDGITIVSYVINNTTYDSCRVSNLKFIGSHYYFCESGNPDYDWSHIFYAIMIHYGMVSSVMIWKVLVVQLILQCLGFISH